MASQKGAANTSKPDEEKLNKSVVAARKVVAAQDAAANLKERAKAAVNPKERMKLMQDAYDKEIEAWGESKYAKRLQSGAWQGGAAGGGIGAGVAMGLGGLVGTLVTGLVAVPTTVVGGLVGAGVGGIHGPWFNFGKGEGKKSSTSEGERQAAAMAEANRLDDAVERGAAMRPQRPTAENGDQERPDEEVERKRPRKLQARSANEMPPPQSEKRKPRKLQVRSGA